MIQTYPHWLTYAPEVMLGIGVDQAAEKAPSPLCFLIGAGASHSSGGPPTGAIIGECRRRRTNVFPDEEAVYENFSELTPRERDRLIRPLFQEMTPYVGYRCMAAMARHRPVFVVNLNWDNCVGLAAEKVGVPFERFDLRNVEKGLKSIAKTEKRGKGIVCAHVHGYLDAGQAGTAARPDADAEHGIRFARPETSSFLPQEVTVLGRLLSNPTIVVGTSLVGSPDAHQMLQALLPAAPDQPTTVADAQVEPLWVFERGAPARAPGFGSRITVALSNALLARGSKDNFISNSNVDFDMLLTTLRAEELGLRWPHGEPPKTRLPELDELVLPNPDAVRAILDGGRSLIVGSPFVGSSTLAYLLAWWRCLTEGGDGTVRHVRGLQGPGEALDYLKEGRLDRDRVGAIVIDDVFDEQKGAKEAAAVRQRLTEALDEIGDCRVFATASPDALLATGCGLDGSLQGVFESTVVPARTLWRPAELRAWAKASGGDRAEIVCREIRMDLISTPSQAIRTLHHHVPHEQQRDWQERLERHLKEVYPYRQRRAMALAILRLQDFSVPRSVARLAELTGEQAQDELARDPWGLGAPIEVDGEGYRRLANPAIVKAVDEWMAGDEDGVLLEMLREKGACARWTVEALERWQVFHETDALAIPPTLSPRELELFGSEYVKEALRGGEPQAAEGAVEALWRIWESNEDHWIAKDVALDLVLHWEELGGIPRARDLRNRLLREDAAMGAYAFFEAILRVGRPASIDLWAATVERLLDLALKTRTEASARRQVALAYDAILWRACPVSREQERKLVDQFLAVGRKDDLLYCAMAGACAYHFEGAERLRKAGHSLPILGTHFDLEKAQEMAWLVEWHFAHQSRCRALSTRRAFLSTMEREDDEQEPRYLDRATRRNPLDPEHEAQVVRYADALLRHPETRGWALHLIMNIQTTTGAFKVPNEHIADLSKVRVDDEGLISAALTYAPGEEVQRVLQGILGSKEASWALQKRLRRGIPIEGVDVVEPRFSMGSDPWVVRARWNAMPQELPLGAGVPQELIEKLIKALDEADEEEVDRPGGERAIAIMSQGDTRGLEVEEWGRLSRNKEKAYLDLLRRLTVYYSQNEDE